MLIRAGGSLLYSTRPKMRDSLMKDTNPKRKRGLTFRPSLTLRVSVRIGREQYTSWKSAVLVACMRRLFMTESPARWSASRAASSRTRWDMRRNRRTTPWSRVRPQEGRNHLRAEHALQPAEKGQLAAAAQFAVGPKVAQGIPHRQPVAIRRQWRRRQADQPIVNQAAEIDPSLYDQPVGCGEAGVAFD